ncbi:MAG TPA: MerR family transcriptional regulator [Vicinamibacterales bacterium]|nr:MerR family transcriptional regulator [Vicinamibacterales bacterium]
MTIAEVPNRSLFKPLEVCEIAQLQPYVLRSWEAEFPDLGVTRPGSPGRVYRRHDLERVLRLKHLLFVEGLTLAGARRRLEEERAALPEIEEVAPPPAPRGKAAGAGADSGLKEQLKQLRGALKSLLEMLDHGRERRAPVFELNAEAGAPARSGRGKPAKASARPRPRNGRARRNS